MDYQAIRTSSEKRLRSAGMPVHSTLPLLDERPLRSPQEVARRVVALYCLAGLANGASGAAMSEWIATSSLELCFEPNELELLGRRDISEEEKNELSWCQESLHAAGWSLALVSELGWPNTEADLDELFPRIPPEVDTDAFIRGASLRSDEQLVEMDDLYYCLDASLRHDELWNGAVESRYPMVQIVMERRRTLDWIMQECAWSEIALDT